MIISTVCDIGDSILIYNPENDSITEKIIDNILIIRNGDNRISNKSIILRADEHNNVICSYDKLINITPDEAGLYYFRNEKAIKLFKELMEEK